MATQQAGTRAEFVATPEEAGEWLARETRDGDVVLMKASRDPRLAALSRLAGRVDDARDRAVLLEALEALLPPREQARLLPLLEDRDAATKAAGAVRALGIARPTPEEAPHQAQKPEGLSLAKQA